MQQRNTRAPKHVDEGTTSIPGPCAGKCGKQGKLLEGSGEAGGSIRHSYWRARFPAGRGRGGVRIGSVGLVKDEGAPLWE